MSGRFGDGGTLLSFPRLMNLNRRGVSGVLNPSDSDAPLSSFGSVLILTGAFGSGEPLTERDPAPDLEPEPEPEPEPEVDPWPGSETPRRSSGVGLGAEDFDDFEEDDCELLRAIISSAADRLCGCGERYSIYEDDLERERPYVPSSVLLFCDDGLSFLDVGLPLAGVPVGDGRPLTEGAGVGAASVL